MPLYSSKLHLGLAKETTQGTAVAAATWMPVKNNVKAEDVIKWIDDKGLRGAPAMTFGTYQGPMSSEAAVDGDLFWPIACGNLLMAILGQDTVAGAGPYSHAFTLAAGQPPSYTLALFNGYEERAYPGSMLEELGLKFAVDGGLEWTTKWIGWQSQAATTTTPTIESDAPFLGWEAAITLGGTADVHLTGFDLTLKRKGDLIWAANDSQKPHATFLGPLDVTGKLTFAIDDDTELNEMLNNTQPAAVITLTQPSSGPVLAIQMSKCAFQKLTPSFSKDYVESDYDVTAIANATDAGSGAPASPCKITLTNTQATSY